MAVTKWVLPVEDGFRTIEAQHSSWRTRHRVLVGGEVVFDANVPVEFGRHISFEVEGHSCVLEIDVPGRLSYHYALRCDGELIPIESGAEHAVLSRG